MFHMPTSSPMMKRMFGFLPACWVAPWLAFGFGSASARSWPLLSWSQQAALVPLESVRAIVDPSDNGAASALEKGFSLPDAAREPSRAPAARTATICTLVLRSISPLLMKRSDHHRRDDEKSRSSNRQAIG